MFRGFKPQMSGNLSLQQHAGQSPIHTRLGSIKSIRMLRMEWTCILTCKRLLEEAPVCMWGECSSIIVDLLFDSLWNLRASIGFVPCVMVSRSIVVHWDGAWSASHPWSAVLSAVVGQVRTGRKSTIYRRATSARTVPYPTLLYPTLTYPALPCCSPLPVCLCFSPVCL